MPKPKHHQTDTLQQVRGGLLQRRCISPSPFKENRN